VAAQTAKPKSKVYETYAPFFIGPGNDFRQDEDQSNISTQYKKPTSKMSKFDSKKVSSNTVEV
jgi:hypothetical protein